MTTKDAVWYAIRMLEAGSKILDKALERAPDTEKAVEYLGVQERHGKAIDTLKELHESLPYHSKSEMKRIETLKKKKKE
jgi:hypothetical protein